MRKRIGMLVFGACLCASGQWVSEKTPDAPRTPDGKVNLTGPVGRIDGHPDLSGIWQAEGEPRAPGGLFGIGESTNSKYFRNILSDFKAGEEPLTPFGAELFKKNTGPDAVNPTLVCLPDGVPHADLLPEPFKIIQMPRQFVMLYEVEATFRQIYMDGRKELEDPRPSWMGYSKGRWDGDTLVVDSNGFNDRSWLDAFGHGHSQEMRVQERFHRRDYGHMDVTVTVTDPKVFTKPVTVSFVEQLLPDTDLLEHYCLEDEKDAGHMGKAR